jgi:diadenosine tetraphosphatase ApaH/serine/threonine PP2A family protein phosphatase
VWSDPADIKGWALSPRGAGHLFGQDVSNKFVYKNDISMIARAHQLVLDVLVLVI